MSEPAALLNSMCKGEYWTDLGSGNWAWLPVFGAIEEASRSVLNNSQGVAYLNCRVRFETQNGPAYGYISRVSRSNESDGQGLAMLNSEIKGVRLRNAYVSGGCSREVIVGD